MKEENWNRQLIKILNELKNKYEYISEVGVENSKYCKSNQIIIFVRIDIYDYTNKFLLIVKKFKILKKLKKELEETTPKNYGRLLSEILPIQNDWHIASCR